jgi:hypothetical protein
MACGKLRCRGRRPAAALPKQFELLGIGIVVVTDVEKAVALLRMRWD